MTPRDLAFRLVTLVAYAVIVAAALILTVLYRLSLELADEVRASRNETTRQRLGGHMPKNRKVRDFDSTTLLRAMNAELAARHGDDARVQAHLAEASFYAGCAALPIRKAS